MKIVLKIIYLSLLLFVSSGCNTPVKTEFQTIGDIAVDNQDTLNYRIYFEENGTFVPFIVLSSDYHGNALVMREHLLDDDVYYNLSGEYRAYYKQSNIDTFLNSDYYFRLSESTQRIIVPTKVEIASKLAMDTHENDTEVIERNVFLLSANEVNSSLSRAALKEGDPIAFFKNSQTRVAKHSDSTSDSWMLRSPALLDGNTVIGVSDTGSVGMGGISETHSSAVRPVFCIPPDTPISTLKDNNSFQIKN